MGLKEKFILFCEFQKVANHEREVKGSAHKDTINAYKKSNKLKREILEAIDENSNY